jgi:hypothetical protein
MVVLMMIFPPTEQERERGGEREGGRKSYTYMGLEEMDENLIVRRGGKRYSG